MATTTESYTKAELKEIIMNLHHEISNLRISIAFERAKGSDLAEDSKLAAIAEAQYGIQLFLRELAEMEVGA